MSDATFEILTLRIQLDALAADLKNLGIGPLTFFDKAGEVIKQVEKKASTKSDSRPQFDRRMSDYANNLVDQNMTELETSLEERKKRMR